MQWDGMSKDYEAGFKAGYEACCARDCPFTGKGFTNEQLKAISDDLKDQL